jgi:hypothetical protein
MFMVLFLFLFHCFCFFTISFSICVYATLFLFLFVFMQHCFFFYFVTVCHCFFVWVLIDCFGFYFSLHAAVAESGKINSHCLSVARDAVARFICSFIHLCNSVAFVHLLVHLRIVSSTSHPFFLASFRMYPSDIPSTRPVANQQAHTFMQPFTAPPILAGNPLSALDVVQADREEYVKSVGHRCGSVTDQELTDTKIRTHQVLSVHAQVGPAAAAVAPGWFHAAQQPMLQLLQQVQQQQQQTHLHILALTQQSAKNWNSAAGDGITKPWMPVPFLDGGNPTEAPHNLPPVTNVGELCQLAAIHQTAYLRGYGIAIGLNRPEMERRQALGRAIGYFGQP